MGAEYKNTIVCAAVCGTEGCAYEHGIPARTSDPTQTHSTRLPSAKSGDRPYGVPTKTQKKSMLPGEPDRELAMGWEPLHPATPSYDDLLNCPDRDSRSTGKSPAHVESRRNAGAPFWKNGHQNFISAAAPP